VKIFSFFAESQKLTKKMSAHACKFY